jgi:hypothetical protein
MPLPLRQCYPKLAVVNKAVYFALLNTYRSSTSPDSAWNSHGVILGTVGGGLEKSCILTGLGGSGLFGNGEPGFIVLGFKKRE